MVAGEISTTSSLDLFMYLFSKQLLNVSCFIFSHMLSKVVWLQVVQLHNEKERKEGPRDMRSCIRKEQRVFILVFS